MPETGTHGYPEIQGPSTVLRHLPSAGSAFVSVAPAHVEMAPERR